MRTTSDPSVAGFQSHLDQEAKAVQAAHSDATGSFNDDLETEDRVIDLSNNSDESLQPPAIRVGRKSRRFVHTIAPEDRLAADKLAVATTIVGGEVGIGLYLSLSTTGFATIIASTVGAAALASIVAIYSAYRYGQNEANIAHNEAKKPEEVQSTKPVLAGLIAFGIISLGGATGATLIGAGVTLTVLAAIPVAGWIAIFAAAAIMAGVCAYHYGKRSQNNFFALNKVEIKTEAPRSRSVSLMDASEPSSRTTSSSGPDPRTAMISPL